MLGKQIDQNTACTLIALDDMFEATGIQWGQDFLEDYFLEQGNIGFDIKHFYLIEESAPIKLFQSAGGDFTSMWYQGDLYWTLIDNNTGIRYRIGKNTKIVLTYKDKLIVHSVCIPAHTVNNYLNHFEFVALFLPLYGLIVDNI